MNVLSDSGGLSSFSNALKDDHCSKSFSFNCVRLIQKSQNCVLFQQGLVKRGQKLHLQYLSAHIIFHQDLCKLIYERGNETRQDGWFYIAQLPEYWLYIPNSARANSIRNRTVSNSTDSYCVCRTNSRLCYVQFYFFLFRRFTLKPPYSIGHDKLRMAIWDTSFWTLRHILGPILVIFEICQFLTIPGPFEYFSENGWSQKIKVFSMKERLFGPLFA